MSKKLEFLISGKDQLTPAAKTAENSLKGLGDAAKTADVKTEGLWKQMAGGVLVAQAVAAAANAAAQAMVGFVTESIELYNIQVRAETQLAATLKSTGNAVGISADEFKRYASELQSVTTFGDETIISAQALLLKFDEIGKDIMPQATKAALDFAQATGKDLNAAAQRLGQALSDPELAFTALRREIGKVSDESQAAVKSFMAVGDTISAQQVIIDEFNRRFGGSAEAFAKTTEGMWQQMLNVIGDIKEEFGGALMQTLLPMMEQLKKWILENKDAIAEFAKKAAEALGEFILWLKDCLVWIVENKEAIVTLGEAGVAAFAAIKVAGLASLGALAGPLGAAVAAAKILADITQRGRIDNKEIERRAAAAVDHGKAYKEASDQIIAMGVSYRDLSDAIQDHQGYVDGVMMSEWEAFEAMRQKMDLLSGPLKDAVEKYNASLTKVESENIDVALAIEKVEKAAKTSYVVVNQELEKTAALILPSMKASFFEMPGLINDTDIALEGVYYRSGDISDTWTELNSQAELFQKALKSVFGALDAVGVKTGNLGSIFGTALGGAQAGFGMLSAAKDAKGFDKILGQVGGVASIVSAGIGLLGGLADALGFTKTGLDKTVEGLKRVGIAINDNLVKQLQEARKAGKDVGAEMAKVTHQIIKDTELTEQNFGTLSKMVRDVFMQFDNGRLSVEEATKAYGKAFTELAWKAEEAGLAGSKALADMIGDARSRGMVGADMLAYIDPARMDGLNAMAKHIAGTADTQEGFQAAMRQTMAFYASMIADGKGALEMIEALGPALDQLKTIGGEKGYDTGYLAELLGMRDFVEQNKDVIDAIQATQTVMDSMAKTGILTADRFAEFAKSASDYYDKLTAEGKNSKEAIQALLPMLGKQLWYAEQYGYELDENTKRLIEEAKAQGLKLDAAIPAEERMAAGIEKLVELFERLTGGIDASADAIGRLGAGIGNLPSPPGVGKGQEDVGFATGTNWRPMPRRFTVGEFAQETIETRGGFMKVTPGNGRGGSGREMTINLNLPNVHDPYSAKALADDIRINRDGIRTELERLAVN